MKILRIGALAALVLVAACSFASSASVSAEFQWTPPPQGVIRDKAAAISIARSIWFSMNPSLKKSSEEVWQKRMEAELIKGVWHVRQKSVGSKFVGGGLEIDLNAKDGKVVRVILTQ
jgi:hypothetical protein